MRHKGRQPDQPEESEMEKRIDEMMDPKRPDPAPQDQPTRKDAASGLPPIDIFSDPKTAPNVPPEVLKEVGITSGNKSKKITVTKHDDPPAEDKSVEPGENDEPVKPAAEPEADNSPAAEEQTEAPISDKPDADEDSEPFNDDKTDAAVDEITRGEGDKNLAEQDASVAAAAPPPKKSFKLSLAEAFKKWWVWALVILAILAGLYAWPFTRYKVAGLFVKETFTITVLDSKNLTPISGAEVNLDGKQAMTDQNGKTGFTVPVGNEKLSVKKQYYKEYSSSVTVPLWQHGGQTVELVATGRQVPVRVINKLTGKPVVGATVGALDTKAVTGKDGTATIVLPVGSPTQAGNVSADGYNSAKVTVRVTAKVVPANTFSVTPAGRVFFLSNLSGNIDVVSTNLDGGDRQTALAGTGSEDANGTVLIASRDWKYLALLSKRDGGSFAKLFLISTTTNKLTVMDQSAADLTPVGWSGHNFVYQADRSGLQAWQTGQQAVKSYNADAGKVTLLDQSSAVGDQNNSASQSLAFVDLLGSRVIYGLAWSQDYQNTNTNIINGKKNSVYSINADGTSKTDLRDIALPNGATYSNMNALVTKPETLEIQSSIGSQPNVYYTYDYSNNSVSQSSTITDASFSNEQQNQSLYLISPSGNQTFWSEQRDGGNTLFVGDNNADNGKQVATLSDYTPYGWYTDNYLLFSEGSSKLFIMPVSDGKPLKVSDFYESKLSFYRHGTGYWVL